ncbi:MAG: c-type cytochrome [Actinobacteria bacterium]|nr:c-type cytochrome [Actinomycetota bacterium]MBW3649322.1 c-type cytochrome [Actinomycetota bacterium]
MRSVRSRLGVLCLVALFMSLAGLLPVRSATPATLSQMTEDGRQLYLRGCSSCHGLDGTGTPSGPSLERSGAASAYYYLSTGRMPLADEAQPRRKPPAYSRAQIDLLVDYVASLGSGPAIPEVHLETGDLAEGGVLYRSNCGPCHTAAGIGGALSYGRAAPSVTPADPVEAAAAIRTGPGQMPVFGPEALSDHEVASIVRYIRFLESPPTPGGAALGGAGPIPEGFVAWIFGVGTLVLAVLWIGKLEGGHGRH